MESYAVARVKISPMLIQRAIHVSNLQNLCGSIDKVLLQHADRGEIYCVWGEFKVHRQRIRQSVRFTLPDCPNAVQWTITIATDDPDCVRIHCTIDQPQHDPDFVDSLLQFIDAIKKHINFNDLSRP